MPPVFQFLKSWLLDLGGTSNFAAAAPQDLEGRLAVAFQATERRGLMIASLVRLVIVTVLLIFVGLTGRFVGDGVSFLAIATFGLALIGLVQFEVARRFRHLAWPKYVLVSIDCAYLAFFLIARHMAADDLPPPTLAVKEGGLLFFTAFLIQAGFSYSPRFVLWTGLNITVAWVWVLVVAASQPGTFFNLQIASPSSDQWMSYGNPAYLPIIKIVYDYLIVVLLTVSLSVAVWRSRHLVKTAAMTERARSNLARHFSPAVIDTISKHDRPFDNMSWQPAAVLFADIRGFTTLCETMQPKEIVEFLRQFHSRMEACIFRSSGTLDKMIGDGLLAVFGMPHSGRFDATNALRCAFEMLNVVEAWNNDRRSNGQFSLRIGIGIHFGDVMLGDIGSERLTSFTVIGNTVNVASRLEGMTKELGMDLIVSAELLDAARAENNEALAMLDQMKALGPHRPRGRDQDIYLFGFEVLAR